eukprot:gene17732-biopygen11407
MPRSCHGNQSIWDLGHDTDATLVRSDPARGALGRDPCVGAPCAVCAVILAISVGWCGRWPRRPCWSTRGDAQSCCVHVNLRVPRKTHGHVQRRVESHANARRRAEPPGDARGSTESPGDIQSRARLCGRAESYEVARSRTESSGVARSYPESYRGDQ